MGKAIPPTFQRLTRLVISNRTRKARPDSGPTQNPVSPSWVLKPEAEHVVGVGRKSMEMGSSQSTSTSTSASASASASERRRLPLSSVVGDCVRRWFEDALREAQAGDAAMQVLVGQMYNSGYGVQKNPQKGKAWIGRASKSRSSALKVGDKRPGYVVSDSDSEDGNDNDNDK